MCHILIGRIIYSYFNDETIADVLIINYTFNIMKKNLIYLVLFLCFVLFFIAMCVIQCHVITLST